MVRKISEDALRRREDAGRRVRWVLENLFVGRQVRMAAAMGLSQSLISRIVGGQRGPGPDFLYAMSRVPGLNPRWVESGEGEPLLPPTRGTLPIAREILPADQASWPATLTGERHPVADAFQRPSRYWVRLAKDSPVLGVGDLALLPGDLLLFESDRAAWEGRLTEHIGQVCGVRQAGDGNDRYGMALLRIGDNGPTCVLPGVRAVGGAERPGAKKSQSTSTHERNSRVLILGGEDEPPPPLPKQVAVAASEARIESEDIVAIRVYTTRP